MKPKLYDVEFITKEELVEGTVYQVSDEFKKNDKFPRNFLVGTIILPNKETRLLSLNKTSYKAIGSVYGGDTNEWIGKNIIYKGEQQMGAMKGKLFEAVK